MVARHEADKFLAKLRLGVPRVLSAACGICAIAWATSAILVYSAEARFASAAQYILSGVKYNSKQLDELRRELNATSASSLQPAALGNIATIRLRLMEAELSSGNAAAGLDDLATAVVAALSANPTNSFLWLTEYWVQNLRTGGNASDLNFLRMSYLLGPNEGWIAIRRNPVALSAFPSLPADLAEQVLAEFTGLVRSGFSSEAADILAGAGWPIHEKLLAGLAQVEVGERRRFARALESKDLDGVAVPGMEERHRGPF